MSWANLRVSSDASHHVTAEGAPAYAERFDEVLKFHAPGLAPVQRDCVAWHIRTNGTAAYIRRFTRTFGFYEGLAAVADVDGWRHITPEGADAYAERYVWCGNFQDGRCTVRVDDRSYLHVDAIGRPAYTERWRYAGDYRDGIAVVQAADGRSTHIDRDGQMIHERWFVDLDVFHKGYARARDEDGWAHVNADGVPAYARRFAAVEPFYNGQARVEGFDGALEVIDERGARVVELRPPRRSEFAALSGDLVGFWRTQTIAAAVRLGIVEALSGTVNETAERCDLHADRAHRLLRALAELQLVTLDAGRWALTPRGALLRAEHPQTLADAALEYAGPFSRMWEGLPDALRRDSAWSAPDVFAEVAIDDRRFAGHHRMLRSYARHDYGEVPGVLDLRGDERIVDAGGGLGELARLILRAHPSVRVTVLDRPEVVEQAGVVEESPPGLDWRAADLFEPWGLLEPDVVVLSRVLHDWDDTDAARILAHARAVLGHGGRVYVVEMLTPECGVAGALCDLHLLMATGGRERSAAEYQQLLVDAGFELDGIRTIPALVSVLVGVVP